MKMHTFNRFQQMYILTNICEMCNNQVDVTIFLFLFFSSICMAAFAPWPLVGELFGVNNETGIVTRAQKQHYGNCSRNL